MDQTGIQQNIPLAPQAGEIVVTGQRPGCITRVIGAINGRWWVETTAARYAMVQAVLHDSGHTRIWAVRPHSG